MIFKLILKTESKKYISAWLIKRKIFLGKENNNNIYLIIITTIISVIIINLFSNMKEKQ